MTKAELIKMTGNEEQANFAMEIVMEQLNKDFVRKAIEIKLSTIKAEIKNLEEQGVICTSNGIKKVNWNPRYDRELQSKASRLIYEQNRITSLLCAR